MIYFLRIFSLMFFLALGLPGLAMANGCAPATSPGTAPADYKAYCWLDFSGYSNTVAQQAGGQAFSFNLPDGSTLNMRVTTTKISGGAGNAINTVAVPSWSGAAFGNTAFIGIPGQTILYSGISGSTVEVLLSNISVTPPSGGTGSASYSIIVGDGESSNQNEALTFETSGDAWTQVAVIPNGSSTNYPTVSGAGTKTVTLNGQSGTVGSYVFASFNNPTTVKTTIKAGGLQGFIVGVRYASVSVVSQISGQRYNTPDQFSYGVKTNGGTSLASGATNGTALTGFTPAALPTVAASYPFVVSEVMAAGSTGTLANYTTSLTCTNANSSSSTVLPSNLAATSYTIASLKYGDAVTCVFTNTPIFSPVVGNVYNDANHNGSQDGSEAGVAATAQSVKLATSSAGVCQTPALGAATVNTTTGVYSLSGVAPGNYCLILSNNATLADIIPSLPTGRLGVQNASGIIQLAVATTVVTPPQNFGLYNGATLTGTVFADTGAPTGTANNGVMDGTEAGLGGVTVGTGSAAVSGTVSAGDGSYTLWIPASATGALTVTAQPGSAYLATGGTLGTTGGTYTRPSLVFTPVAGQSYTAANFGLVTRNTLAPNNAETAPPGTTVNYAHMFVADSGGSVTFSLSGTATPASTAWSEIIYRDSNCNAVLESTEPAVTGPIAVTAGQTVCLIVKEFVPAGAATGAVNTVTLTAAFTYTGASPALSATLTAVDVTTVGQPGALALGKLVNNVTQGGAAATVVNAKPGDMLQYTLTATNNGSQPLSTLQINDATPAFTTFLSASCPAVLPSGITACAISTQPAVGAQGGIQWTLTGVLAPAAQIVLTYRAKVDQ